MAETSEAIKKRRSIAKRQFTRAESDLNNAMSQADVPVATINRRFETAKQRWSEVQDAHDEYIGTIITDDAPATDEDRWIEEMEGRFAEIEINYDTLCERRTPPVHTEKEIPATKNVVEVNRSSHQPSLIKLERLKFKSFGGDIRKFPQFKEEFVRHIEPQCQKPQLALVLRSYLSEAIQDEVESAGDNYDRIWSRLTQKYGNTGKLVDAIIYEVKNLPKSNNAESTIHMINVVEKATRDLERLDQGIEMCNATIISHIEERMTNTMKEEWVKTIASKSIGSDGKFRLLMELLCDWRNRLEYMTSSVRNTAERSSKTHLADQQSTHAVNPRWRPNDGRGKPKCWIHKDDTDGWIHPVWRCKDFKEKPFQEKLRMVRLNKACELCLETNCPGVSSVRDCKSGFQCLIRGCGKAHNVLLHPASNDLKGTASHASTERQHETTQESPILQLQSF